MLQPHDLFYAQDDYDRFWNDAQREEWRKMMVGIPLLGTCLARSVLYQDEEESMDDSETTETTVVTMEEEDWTESDDSSSDHDEEKQVPTTRRSIFGEVAWLAGASGRTAAAKNKDC